MVEKNRKKTIALVTNWYPTEENPYAGLFFKEQALIVKEHFNFIVIHLTERRKIGLIHYICGALMHRNYYIERVKVESNITEYSIIVSFPVCTHLMNLFANMWYCRVKKYHVEGVGTFRAESYRKMKKKVFQDIYEKILKKKVDVFYCVDAQGESSDIQIFSEISGKPYVVAEHAPIPWPGGTIDNQNHRAIEQADAFIAISQDKLRQMLLQNIKLPRIYQVSNFVDEMQFQLSKKDTGIKTFIIVAANSFYKNYDLLIAVMNKLSEITDVLFKIMIVGYASNKGYSQHPEQLEMKIRNSKFAKSAIMIPEVSHSDIQDLYQQADAFLMTSIQEGFPVSALEAACCGLPIFSTRCGGVEDYVTADVGRILPICDIDAFALVLKEYLEETITFNKEAIRKKIISLYGREAFIERFVNCFEETIEIANTKMK